jgi:NhaP-type Na+/H+ or K+/H+ antiporter
VSVDPLNLTTSVTVVAGVASQALARRLRVPAIVPLLTLGIVLGALGVVQPDALGAGLRVIVGFAVAIVLFEGGLTLKTESFRLAGRAIRNLVIYGALITWSGAALVAGLLFPELDPGLAILYGSLVIVTGPTVILPILHATRLRKRVADVLRGEAILIDPVGALYAVLVLEYLIASDEHSGVGVLLQFGLRILLGTTLGAAGAFALRWLLQRQEASPDLRNLTVLSGAIGLYSLSESLSPESGVLTVTLAGFLLGWLEPPGLDSIEEFKGHVTTLMVSIVFILLAADLALDDVAALGWRGAVLISLLILVVRPLTVFVSTAHTDLVLREKLFLSWIAPRGIVAAAVSSLFALSLAENDMEQGGRTVMALTFLTIIGTVMIQGPSAGLVARMLHVVAERPSGFLIVGANRAGRALGRALYKHGLPVLVVDTNEDKIRTARANGLTAMRVNILDEVAMDQIDAEDLGYLVAMTGNDSANRAATRIHGPRFGLDKVRAIRTEDDDTDTPAPANGEVPKTSPAPRPASAPTRWLFGRRLDLREMERLVDRGEIRLVEVDEDVPLAELATTLEDGIPLLALKKNEARFLDDDDSLRAGERLLYLATAPRST